MFNSIFDELEAARKEHEVATVNFYNDGSIDTDEYSRSTKAKDINPWDNKFALDPLKDAISGYATMCNYDTVKLNIIMGLIYNIEDVDENYNIKEGAKPLNNIVRYYSKDADCYLEGEQTNTECYSRHPWGRQSFLKYRDFVKFLKRNGLEFEGPDTFEEFKDKILSKEVFDMSISAKLINKLDEKKLTRKL